MDRSPGFGSSPSDSSPCSDSLSLRFPYAVKLATETNSLTHYTKGTQSQTCVCSHGLYAHGFRVYFTPLAGVLFTFPSRYWCAIGRQRVFSLGGWSPRLQPGLLVPRLTRRDPRARCFRLRGCHPLWPPVPRRSTSSRAFVVTGLVRVRSPLLTESRLISVPPGTEMVQFPGFASRAYGFSAGYLLRGGLPHSEIPGSMRVYPLPEAFRRLPRPSSPVVA